MKKYQRIFSLAMIFILLFPNLNMTGHAAGAEDNVSQNMITISETSDWQGSVFGDVGGQDKIEKENFDITEKENSIVKLRSSNNRGKIAGSSEGIAYYFQDIPSDGNYELTATAIVDSWDDNGQVGFGIMLRSNILNNENSGSFTGDYVAVGNVKQKMGGFYKYADEDFKHPEDLKISDKPQKNEPYELKIKKSGSIYSISINGETKIIEDYTAELNYAGLFTSRNAEVTFSNVSLDVESDIDLGDWDFNVFGDNTNDERNPDLISDGDSVTIEANGGKISSTVDGISFYHKQVPTDANFEIRTKAKVHQFGANNQVSFGLMLRDQIGEHRVSSGHEAKYIAVGALDQSIKGFYKDDRQTKLATFDSVIPADGSEYDLSIKKSGDTYVLSINDETYETITLEDLFTDEIFVGAYAARDTKVTFNNTEIVVDTRTVDELKIDSSSMKTEYLQGEDLNLEGLEVTAVFSDGDQQDLSADDYIVTGFDSSGVGTNTITINYNGKTATFDVEIAALTVTDLDIKYYPAKTDYYIGDIFDPQGLVVVATYNDGYHTETLTADLFSIVIDGEPIEQSYVFKNSGTKEVVIRSAETKEQATSFNVNVNDAVLEDLIIKDQPEVMDYFIGDQLDLDGMSVYAKYSDGKEVRLMEDEYEVTGFNSDEPGEKELTISHKRQATTLMITVKVKEVKGIEVTNYPKTTYQVGEVFDATSLVVSKVFDNGEREALSKGDYELNIDDIDFSNQGIYDVNVIPTHESLDEIIFKVTVREKAETEWKQIRFGQSTSKDHNTFDISEEMIKLSALGGSAGKVTGDHDGITFYYTEIDAKQDNFVLSADIFVEEYAKNPHDGQESFGIMARDALGPADDSSVFASNIAAIGGFSGGTGEQNGTQLFARTGVLAPDGEGSAGIQKVMIKEGKPNTENTAEDYRLTLAKTNSGFTGQLNNGEEAIIYEPEILKVQDDKMYVGFYTARLATIEVSNIEFTVTDAATDAPRKYPPAEAIEPNVEILSLDKTSEKDYTLLIQSNVDGIVSVKQGQDFIAEENVVKVGEIIEIPAEISKGDTNFSVVFLPDNTQYLSDYSQIVRNFTVTMKTFADGEKIYVSPEGTNQGDGTKENPLDLDTAIEFVQAGQKIVVQEGHYIRNSKLEIKKFNDGTADAMKYLVADPEATERPLIDFDKKSEGVIHSGHYWYVEGIDFARSAGNTKGYTLGGSHNTIENVRTFQHGDTGLQISRTDVNEHDKSKWPSHNLILDSISFDNRDPSDNNADGFAAKLTSGEGNIFRGTVAYSNIDDGWDLYTKVGTGAIGSVIIEDSIAFNNGTMSNGDEGDGDKNGFKLGGEGVHVPHVIKNSLAFGNGALGFTSNSNPGVIATDNISIYNGTNLGFTTYSGIETDFTIDGFISIGNEDTAKDNYPAALASDLNYLFDGAKSSNKSGIEIPTDQSDHMLTLLEELFEYDSEGRILSVKEDKWEDLWATYHKVTDVEEPEDPEEPGDPEDPEDPEDPKDPTDPGNSADEMIDTEEKLSKYVDSESGHVIFNDIDKVTLDIKLIKELKGVHSFIFTQDGIKLTIPFDVLRNLLDDSGYLTISMIDVTKNHSDSLSKVYEFKIEMNGELLTHFKEPLLLTFTVHPEDVNHWNDLVLRYFAEDDKVIDYPMDIENINKETGDIQVEITHFSAYGIFEVKGTAADGEEPIDQENEGSSEDDQDENNAEVDVTVDEDDEAGKQLPQTATSIYNMLMIGIFIMIIGSALFFWQRRSIK